MILELTLILVLTLVGLEAIKVLFNL